MTTRSQHAKHREERTIPPRPPEVHEASRTVRTALRKAAVDDIPTKSARGSEHAQQMKSATAASRHQRRGR